MRKLSLLLLIAFLSVAGRSARAEPVTLNQCGRVIGHEMGLWDFVSANPGPQQVDRVLKSPLKFVKVSLQMLKDGSWIVDHSDSFVMITPLGEQKSMNYADVTWDDVQRLRAEGNSIVMYRLDDYVQRDQGRLCWMLSPKEASPKEASPKEASNDQLVQNLIRLGVADRTVILTYGIPDVSFLAAYPESDHLHFAGRVGSDASALEPYTPLISRLWAMEIDPTANTAAIVKQVHAMGLAAYVDSMRYSWNYELFGTACKKVFGMGVDYSQTNRPLECLRSLQ